jgi:3-hexulose-6-phosphate synthase/6-phospho-3-hexuloisomerase
MTPKLQVAFDFKYLKKALEIANLIYSPKIWLEVGTPLIKSEGIRAIYKFREEFPKATIVADMKTMDAGGIETELASSVGANIVSICGAASDQTIREALQVARSYQTKIMTDLIGVKDLLRRAIELERIGTSYICLHSGIDVQKKGERVIKKLEEIREISSSVKIPIAIAGGICAGDVQKLLDAGAKIIVVGSAITKSSDPKGAVEEILRVIEK